MQVRLIGGIREPNHKDPLGGLYLEEVSFPMDVTNYAAEEIDDPDETTLHNEAQLRAWADVAFEDTGYEIWTASFTGLPPDDPEI